jgi:hypothetical protein
VSFIRRYRTRRFVVALGSFKSCHDQRWMPTFSSRITIDGRVGNNGAAKPIAVALRPREGLLTEPTAGVQPWPRERVLMPLKGPCRRAQAPAELGGYLPLAPGVSTVRYPIPQRTFKYVATVQSLTDETCQSRSILKRLMRPERCVSCRG